MSDAPSRLAAALTGRYTLERELGQGGMATVYLAHDVRHDRKVALKVLRPELAAVIGAERFLAEIRTTASLQHPNILALFDSGTVPTHGDGPDLVYYVMPYVEGESLRDRLAREKQLPVADTLAILGDVAAALEHAHRRGVIHRDIKPENILLVSDGRALVADFGIALAATNAGGGRLTESGLSLGTPRYMSPEQAMAERDLSPRSDVFSLGSVAYEMLVGEPPFSGATPQAVTSRILSETPKSIRQVRDRVPAALEGVIFTALAKAPADRYPSAAAFAQALAASGAVTGSGAIPHLTTTQRTAWTARLAWMAGGVALAVGGTMLASRLRPAPLQPTVRYSLNLPRGRDLRAGTVGTSVAISPDGMKILYVGDDTRLWILDRSQLQPTPVTGSENAINPVFAPDGRRIAYQHAPTLEVRVLPVEGGQPRVVARPAEGAGGVDWSDDGWIYFDSPGGFTRVRENGGPSELAMPYDAAAGEVGVAWPQVLPGGKMLLYRSRKNTKEDDYTIVGWEIESRVRHTVTNGIFARFLQPGTLVVIRSDGSLAAAPFDPRRAALLGAPVVLDQGIMTKSIASPDLAVAANGLVTYVLGPTPRSDVEAVWMSREGVTEPLRPGLVFSSGEGRSLALSPDGRRLALDIAGPTSDDIWIRDLGTGLLTRLTSEGTRNAFPSWEPDGQSLLFISNRSGEPRVWRQRADGSAPAESVAVRQPGSIVEVHRAPDGRGLIYVTRVQSGGTVDRDIYLQGATGESAIALLHAPTREFAAALSPNGRWMAYQFEERGQSEVYVRPFPATGSARWQVSNDGGGLPQWSHSGRELFYESPSGELMVVPIGPGPAFEAGTPVRLRQGPSAEFRPSANTPYWAVSPDDRRFLRMQISGLDSVGIRLVVVENLADEARRHFTSSRN
ncbi:MAG: LpqB family beta-propeller domain-containing protein [Gemmatimonadales bacterium]